MRPWMLATLQRPATRRELHNLALLPSSWVHHKTLVYAAVFTILRSVSGSATQVEISSARKPGRRNSMKVGSVMKLIAVAVLCQLGESPEE